MSTGGRVFPSITGGGLSQATGAILSAQMAARAEALQARQLDITERAQKINQLTTLSSLVPTGTTLGDLGAGGLTLFTEALGVDATGLEALELKPETFQTALDSMRQEFLDTPEAAELLAPSTRVALGLGPSADIAEAADLEAQMRVQALTDIRDNPEFTREFTARALGREPIKLRIPGVPGETEFESSQAAAIYAQFLLARENQGFQIDLGRRRAAADLAADEEDPVEKLTEEIRGAVSDAGFSIGSDVLVNRVLPLYNAAIESGDPAEVAAFLNDPLTTPGERLAMQFILGSIAAGDAAFFDSVSPELGIFFRMSDRVKKSFPDNPLMARRFLQDLTQAMDPAFTAQSRESFFGKLSVEIGGVPVGDQTIGPTRAVVPAAPPPGARADGTFDVRQAPDAILLDEVRNSLADGTATREELIGLVGQDVVDRAVPLDPSPGLVEGPGIPVGGIDSANVPTALLGDVQRLNNLIRTLDRTQGELARRNLQNVIDRLRTRIERGMIGG